MDMEPSVNLYGCHGCRDGVKDLNQSYLFRDVAEVGTKAEKIYRILTSS